MQYKPIRTRCTKRRAKGRRVCREKYLQPADQVKLNAGMSGISMDLISRFPAKEIPLPNLTESIQVSEKKEKLSIPKEPKKRVRKEKSKVKSVKIK